MCSVKLVLTVRLSLTVSKYPYAKNDFLDL